jgi:hypothetical protein
MNTKKGFFEMTKHQRQVAMDQARNKAENATGMNLTPEQVQDYVLFYFVSRGFSETLDDFMVRQNFVPKNTKN